MQTFDRMLHSRPLDEFFFSELHEMLREISDGAAPSDGQNAYLADTNAYLSEMTLKIPTLRYQTLTLLQQPHAPSNIPAVLDLMRRCRLLDTALAAWPSTRPQGWKYKTTPSSSSFSSIPSPPSSPSAGYPSYPGVTHTYCDIWVANIWNSYRINRLMVNSCIIRCVAWLVAGSPADPNLDTTHPEAALMPEYVDARRICLDMFNDICASTQYHLEPDYGSFNVPSPRSPGTTADAATMTRGQNRSAKALGAYLLVRPLFVARAVIYAPKPQLRWVTGLMRHVAATYGLKLGAMVAMVDEEKGWPLFDTGPVFAEGRLLPGYHATDQRMNQGVEVPAIDVEMVG